MHCVRFEMRLNRLLDDRASPDSDLELVEHARECPDCAELLTANELLLRGIESCDGPFAGPDLAVRVAASPLVGPSVEDVVQVHVREQRRCRCSLRRPVHGR